jgi:hypothetical protein
VDDSREWHVLGQELHAAIELSLRLVGRLVQRRAPLDEQDDADGPIRPRAPGGRLADGRAYTQARRGAGACERHVAVVQATRITWVWVELSSEATSAAHRVTCTSAAVRLTDSDPRALRCRFPCSISRSKGQATAVQVAIAVGTRWVSVSTSLAMTGDAASVANANVMKRQPRFPFPVVRD